MHIDGKLTKARNVDNRISLRFVCQCLSERKPFYQKKGAMPANTKK